MPIYTCVPKVAEEYKRGNNRIRIVVKRGNFGGRQEVGLQAAQFGLV